MKNGKIVSVKLYNGFNYGKLEVGVSVTRVYFGSLGTPKVTRTYSKSVSNLNFRQRNSILNRYYKYCKKMQIILSLRLW